MKLKSILNSMLLVLTALIWGSAFVAQSVAMDAIKPFTFNTVRNFLGSLVLIPLVLFLRSRRTPEEKAKENKKTLLLGGVCCGAVLAVASILQQYGIAMSTVGKSGFITAMYIILVPIIGVIFFKKRYSALLWVGVAASLVGLWLLCMMGETSFGIGDLMLLFCAIAFSGHILIIDHFSPKVDCVAMSCIQFFVCGLLCAGPMLIFETPSISDIIAARVPILYAGIMSSGVAYTLQIVGQKRTPPVLASMIFSLESVFAALSGWLFLHESMSFFEFLGCALMFAAIIVAQLAPEKKEELL